MTRVRALFVVALAYALLSTASAARATSFVHVDVTCPVPLGAMPKTNHDWRARLSSRMRWERAVGVSLGSLTVFRSYLDGRPENFGLPPLASCPRSGLVLYKWRFSSEEVRRLKHFMGNSRYAWLRQHATSRYFAAQLMRVLGESPRAIAVMLLHATWEARTSTQYSVHASEALGYFMRALEDPKLEYYPCEDIEMLAGELERRLGLFERAHARFSRLRPDSPPATRRVTLELELIQRRDSSPQLVP